MVVLEQEQITALYRHQNTADWVGETQMTSRWCECVPFTVNGQRYLASFFRANYINGFGSYKEMLFATTDGGVFMPKYEHRHISLHTISDAEQLIQLDADAVPPEFASLFVFTLLKATLEYQRSNRHVNQYFFHSDGELGPLVKTRADELLTEIGGALSITFYEELAAPMVGFTLIAAQRAETAR